MVSQHDNILALFRHKLKFLRELEILLRNSLRENRDNSWGAESVKKFSVYFEELRKLDDLNPWSGIDEQVLANSSDLAGIANDMAGTMKNIKDHLTLFQLRLEGGKQILADKLREVGKAKVIKGYRAVLGR